MSAGGRRLSPEPGRFIAIYGPSGSGKSTLARAVAARLGLPLVELDAVYHGPGWSEPAPEVYRARVQELLDRYAGGWVFDGNYSVARDLVLPRATTAVWLRLPFRVVFPRLVGRTLRRVATREELWNGNRETMGKTFLSRESILLWGITNWRPHRRKTRRMLREVPHSARIVVLRSPPEVAAWLDSLPRADVAEPNGAAR
ncbi:MAG: AAA family ATPase [Dehalococcoidia bacterium]|nr:AAA family ATPase [Dehalococcoidia bacterium]